MSNAKFQKCLEFLQKKFVKVQNDWLEACIEWIIEENQQNVLSTNELCDLVYEQWLLADLREIAESSFPPNASLKKKSELKGNFCVQVNSVLDISQSAYSQLQKLKGQEIEYDDADANDAENNEAKEFFKKSSEDAKIGKSNKKWKDSSCRMLLLELHDGAQMVEGIEYQPINQLSQDNLLPGSKVLLTGPITCRDGMLLLKAANVRCLGGNAEQLMESNSQLNILNKILKLNEDNKEGIINTSNLQRTSLANSNNPRSGQSQNSRKSQSNVKPRSTLQTAQKQSRRNEKIPTNTKAATTKKENETFIPEDVLSDFDDDLQDFQDLDLLTDNKPRTKNGKSLSIKQSKLEGVTEPKSVKARKTSDIINLFDSDFEEDLLLDEETVKENPKEKVKNEVGLSRDKMIEEEFLQNDMFIEDDFDINWDVDINKGEQQNLDDVNDIPNDDFTHELSLLDDIKESEQLQKDVTINEMVNREEPLKGCFTVKGMFKTLASSLEYSQGFRLFAFLTDDHHEKCSKVLLGNEALTSLIGFTAEKVQQAVSNKLQGSEREKIKKSIKMAEKALEMNKWRMEMKFNNKEEIYEVVSMKPVFDM